MNLLKIDSKCIDIVSKSSTKWTKSLLARVRLHHADFFCHEVIARKIGCFTNTGKVRPCVRDGSQSAPPCTGAGICEVHLCATAIPGSSSDSKVTCHHRWHVSTDQSKDTSFAINKVAAIQSDEKNGEETIKPKLNRRALLLVLLASATTTALTSNRRTCNNRHFSWRLCWLCHHHHHHLKSLPSLKF
jgi:hypothetical protein